MTKKVKAQELKKGDTIIIKSPSHAGVRRYTITTDPELDDRMWNAFGKRLDGQWPDEPLQFAKHTEIEQLQ
jgi:hypothetical protein